MLNTKRRLNFKQNWTNYSSLLYQWIRRPRQGDLNLHWLCFENHKSCTEPNTTLTLLNNRVGICNCTTCKFNVALFKFEVILWYKNAFLAWWKWIKRKWFYNVKKLRCFWYIWSVSIRPNSFSLVLLCTLFYWCMVKCSSQILYSWL